MNVSNTFRGVLNLGPEFHIKADALLKSGVTLNLEESDFMVGTFGFVDSTSSQNKLEVGSAAAQQFKATLNNFYNKFTSSEFDGAVITPYVGLVTKMDWRGYTIEWCKRGKFTADESKNVGSGIQLSALDNMAKFDQPYTKSKLSYPATLGQILEDACTSCGVALATTTFTNSGYLVTKRPSDSALTFRDVISYIGQLSGNFCRCNTDGALEIRWYDFSRFGLANDDTNRPVDIIGITSSDIKKADISVTGVQITGNDDAKTVYSSGASGFTISIGNPFAQDGLQAVADTLGSKLIGMTIRPFTAAAGENPAIEAGDVCYITDADGNKYKSIISNLTYTIGQNESFSGDAESPGENNSTMYSPADKAQDAADKAKREVELTNVTIGKLNVRVTATEEGLLSKVSKDDISSEIQQHPEDVVFAFNNLLGDQELKFTGNGFDIYSGSTKIAHIGATQTGNTGTTVTTYASIESVDDTAGIAFMPKGGKGLYLLNPSSNQSGYDLMHLGYAFFESGVASHGLISTTGNMGCQKLTCQTFEAEDATASGPRSHAEGGGTTASAYASHAEGQSTVASGLFSHAEGLGTTASGEGSHAEGVATTASGLDSHAEGAYTIAHDYAEHAGGEWNKNSTGNQTSFAATNNAFVIGNGTGIYSSISNCFRVDFSGNVYGSAAYHASGADYAEYFEWLDGNPDKEDRAGHFVTLDGSKIRLAKPEDDVFGIVSGCPSVVGDAASESWSGRYARDIFGRPILEMVNVPAEYDKDGKVTREAHTELRQKVNPDYDPAKESDYVSREKRPEWSAVGMHGKLVLIDDGTCQPNKYCEPAPDGTGIATITKERNNCRVMERLDKTHIRVCLK